MLKFVFSKKATKFDKIFTVDLTLTTYCQIDGEDFVKFCGLLRKHELYPEYHNQKEITTNHFRYEEKCRVYDISIRQLIVNYHAISDPYINC